MKLSGRRGHIKGAGYYGMGRECAECRHSEYRHFNACADCRCPHFAARKLSNAEKAIQRQADWEQKRKSEWTGDPYSEFKRHLDKVVVEASE